MLLTFKKQIVMPLIFASLILGGALGGLFYAVYQMIEASIVEYKIDKIRYEILSLQSAIVQTEAGQRGYLLTNNESFVDTYEAGKTEVEKLLTDITPDLEGLQELKPIFSKIRTLVDTKLRNMEAAIQIQMNSGAYAPHLNSVKTSASLMDQINLLLKQADNQIYQQKNTIHRQTIRSLRQTVGGAAVLVIIIIVLLFSGYRRTIHLFEVAVHSKNIADEYSHDAYHDVLTHLPNRRYFETHMKRMLAMAKRNHQSFAMLYLDLDGFKAINDQYGHDAGDEALLFAAQRFKAALRESDFLARLGGDEFAVIIEQYNGSKELNGLANRVIRYLQQTFKVDGNLCQLGVSIGISIYPDDGLDMEAIISAADSAMYRAKRTGKNRAVFANN